MLNRIFKILFWSLVIWLFVRCFLFQVFRIPSPSMNGALFEGDYVVINKLAYGARLPFTPLSFNKKYVDWVSLPYLRVFGYADIQRNDVIAFNYSLTDELPIDLRQEYIKRCAGLPGDTVVVKNGILFVNGNPSEASTVYNSYSVMLNNQADTNLLKKESIDFSVSGSAYKLSMTSAQAADLLKTGAVKSLTLSIENKEQYDPNIFPNFPEYKWNKDHFGPLFIPREDDSVALTPRNLAVYQRIIERFENVKLKFRNDSVFVNDEYKKYYTFTQDYFFMIGDNRNNSIDSRNWGFIAESHIIGKASMVMYSKKKNRSFSLIKD